jgi:hypothetical protein
MASDRAGVRRNLLHALAAAIARLAPLDGPADTLLSAFFRAHAQLGARDRAFVAEGVFAWLRRRRSLEALAGTTDPWQLALAVTVREGVASVRDLAAVVSPAEAEWLAALKARLREPLPPAVAADVPDWLWERLGAACDADTRLALTRAWQHGAPFDLRVNALKARRDEVGDELAAFVLHLEAAVGQPRMTGQMRPAAHADAQRRVRRGLRVQSFGLQRGQRFLASRLERIDAQVQRRRLLPRAGEARTHLVTERRAEALPQPVGHVGGHLGRQRLAQAPLEGRQPLGFRLADGVRKIAHRRHTFAHGHGEREAARIARLGERLERAAPAQPREHAFGDEAAIARAERGPCAEEGGQQRIRRPRQRRELPDRGGELVQLVGVDHAWSTGGITDRAARTDPAA